MRPPDTATAPRSTRGADRHQITEPDEATGSGPSSHATPTLGDVHRLAERLDPTTLGVMLVTLRDDHELLVAARLGIELGDARGREHPRNTLREIAYQVHGGDREYWRALAWRHIGAGHPDRVQAARGPRLPVRCEACHTRHDSDPPHAGGWHERDRAHP